MSRAARDAIGRRERDMSDAMRIRVRLKDGVAEAHVLMPHPMETGFREGPDGHAIEAHYITDVRIAVADRPVLNARMSIAVSADPLLSFRFRGGRPGERVTVAWTDNEGESRIDEGVIG